MKKSLPILIIALLLVASGVVWMLTRKDLPKPMITSFEECAAAGYPILETYPEQCRTPDGQSFTKVVKANGTEFGSPVTLRLNEEAKFSDGLTMTLVAINDSRCQSGVVCIWAGELAYQVKLLGGIINQETEIKLGNLTAKSVTQNGYTFTLDQADETTATITVTKEAGQTVCTQEAKLCPDGSYVSRTGPNCEFATCPATGKFCLKDSDCPSANYVCQETQGTGTACPSNDPTCVPTHTVIAGVCKLKVANQCTTDSQCAAGNVCHNHICTSPTGRQCNGPTDTSCPTDFECVPGCGPPIVREPDTTPLKYYCQLKGYIRACPICLAKNTLIATPQGAIAVQNLRLGDPVWTVTTSGERVVGFVTLVSKTAVPSDHKMVQLVLTDGRTLLVSPGHPTIDGSTVGDLVVGNNYDGSQVLSTERVSYGDGHTYDLLPSGETGFYFANGIMLDSTLH